MKFCIPQDITRDHGDDLTESYIQYIWLLCSKCNIALGPAAWLKVTVKVMSTRKWQLTNHNPTSMLWSGRSWTKYLSQQLIKISRLDSRGYQRDIHHWQPCKAKITLLEHRIHTVLYILKGIFRKPLRIADNDTASYIVCSCHRDSSRWMAMYLMGVLGPHSRSATFAEPESTSFTLWRHNDPYITVTMFVGCWGYLHTPTLASTSARDGSYMSLQVRAVGTLGEISFS